MLESDWRSCLLLAEARSLIFLFEIKVFCRFIRGHCWLMFSCFPISQSRSSEIGDNPLSSSPKRSLEGHLSTWKTKESDREITLLLRSPTTIIYLLPMMTHKLEPKTSQSAPKQSTCAQSPSSQGPLDLSHAAALTGIKHYYAGLINPEELERSVTIDEVEVKK